ncbi:hypothetical protein EJB05_38449 [Eragrostis curvula]|uniref:Glucuronosyltransferase PGSIP8 n=1 Tax=Eragrostis curvula TaxID=38414 RepID=A0A5J9TU93_9POAL|nr:hypothetical protein EJB05_38449 [Eragrostis curvula]
MHPRPCSARSRRSTLVARSGRPGLIRLGPVVMGRRWWRPLALWLLVAAASVVSAAAGEEAAAVAGAAPRRHAYAAMMYMGTPRDYEFYVATRVMMRSLGRLSAGRRRRVVIASLDVPPRWVQALKDDGCEGGPCGESEESLREQENFKHAVQVDFEQTPSMDVFKNMLHELAVGLENPDGADQGFLASYFPDLLDQPMFHPPANGTKLDGTYRLPLGYQMDASYYYLKLRWSIPCGPNSVITFPSAPWFKPWYWWSWPVLPLGLSWHEQRRENLGYSSELPVVLFQALLYVGVIAVTRLARPSLSKMCYNRRTEKSTMFLLSLLRVVAVWSILAAYTIPFFIVPRTIHPLLGWPLYLLGSFSLSSIVINIFLLHPLSVLTTWFGIIGALFVMACPWYLNGVVRALAVFAYAFCCAPLIWASLVKTMSSLQVLIERDAFRLGEPNQSVEFTKLY